MKTSKIPGVIPETWWTRHAPASNTTESPPAKINSVQRDRDACNRVPRTPWRREERFFRAKRRVISCSLPSDLTSCRDVRPSPVVKAISPSNSRCFLATFVILRLKNRERAVTAISTRRDIAANSGSIRNIMVKVAMAWTTLPEMSTNSVERTSRSIGTSPVILTSRSPSF